MQHSLQPQPLTSRASSQPSVPSAPPYTTHFNPYATLASLHSSSWNIDPEFISACQWRIEEDSLGDVHIPTKALWGPSTQRCLEHFSFSGQLSFGARNYASPDLFILVLTLIKLAVLEVNYANGVIPGYKYVAMHFAMRCILAGKYLSNQFPLPLLQTGSLTHLNMNVNEIITHLSNDIIIDAIVYHFGENWQDILPNEHVHAFLGETSRLSPLSTPQVGHQVSCPISSGPAQSKSTQILDDQKADDDANPASLSSPHQHVASDYLHRTTSAYSDYPVTLLSTIAEIPQRQIELLHNDVAEILRKQISNATKSTTEGSDQNCSPQITDSTRWKCRAFLRDAVFRYIPAVDANDDVNACQSSNCVVPTATRIMGVYLCSQVVDALTNLRSSFALKITSVDAHQTTLGRTHLQDATPMHLRDQLQAYMDQLSNNITFLETVMQCFYRLPLGGTAVGTGVNTYTTFSSEACARIALLTGLPFVSHPNKIELMSDIHDEVVVSSAFSTIASSLMKLAQDFRLLGRLGGGEFSIAALESGSSIMPSKSNPTQCEQMICAMMKVISNNQLMLQCSTMGQLQLNVCRPMIVYSLLDSGELLAHSMTIFARYCVAPLTFNIKQMSTNVHECMMLATSLTPKFGYPYVSKLVHFCIDNNISLAQGLIREGKIQTQEEFDALVQVETMCQPEQLESFVQKRQRKLQEFYRQTENRSQPQ